jgi:alpha-1,3-mannosyl-glycoprotein beta-1,2-N-acetylglucosaminyltransferase
LDYLRRALASVFRHNPDRQAFPLVVSQDGRDSGVEALIQVYLKQSLVHRHVRFLDGTGDASYRRLDAHYRFALREVFDVENAKQAIVLEEDLEVAPDFFSYFQALLPVLQADPDLFCVSAWNDLGKPQLVSDARAVFRTDFFPGLGWMLLRSFWEELRDEWPLQHWDDFLRSGNFRRGRQCIRPEISRSHHFGTHGVSDGQFQHEHLDAIRLNDARVDWSSVDLEHVSSTLRFDQFLSAQIQAATVKGLPDLGSEGRATNAANVALRYSDRDFSTFARFFGFIDDSRDGIRRGSYRGVIPFSWEGHRVFLLASWPYI